MTLCKISNQSGKWFWSKVKNNIFGQLEKWPKFFVSDWLEIWWACCLGSKMMLFKFSPQLVRCFWQKGKNIIFGTFEKWPKCFVHSSWNFVRMLIRLQKDAVLHLTSIGQVVLVKSLKKYFWATWKKFSWSASNLVEMFMRPLKDAG